MIGIQHNASGASAIVGSTDGYDLSQWTVIGDVPSGVRPDLAKIVGTTIVQDTAPLLNAIRGKRDELLLACDWTQLADAPLTPDKRVDWQSYRQTLRDLPETVDPLSPAWPTLPT